MSVRAFVLLAAICSIVAYAGAVLVTANMLPCVDAVPKYVPGECPCSKPDDEDCDLGSYDWDYDGTVWVIWSDSRFDPFSESKFGSNYYRISIPGEYYPMHDDTVYPYPDYYYVNSVEVDYIALTNAVCGGTRYYNQRTGNFCPKWSGNEDDIVMDDDVNKQECYDFDNCVWVNAGEISGWRPRIIGTEEDGYVEYYWSSQPREMCSEGNNENTKSQAPVVFCDEDDAW